MKEDGQQRGRGVKKEGRKEVEDERMRKERQAAQSGRRTVLSQQRLLGC